MDQTVDFYMFQRDRVAIVSKRPMSIDQLLAGARGLAKSQHLAKLDRPTKAMLEDFVRYLIEKEKLAPGTARAYKSWVAKALVEHGANESHVKSAVAALGRYKESK